MERTTYRAIGCLAMKNGMHVRIFITKTFLPDFYEGCFNF